MKKFLVLITILASCTSSYCQSWSAYRGRTLYLASYGAYNPSTNSCKNPLVCRFGEYMTFGKNGVLTWNSRYGGTNSSYTYTMNGKRINLKPRSGSYDPNDKYIEIIRIQGDNVLTRSNNGVYRIFSTKRQPVITGPGAEITSYTIEHNVYRNNQKGLIVHVDAQFFHVSNHQLRISAYFDRPENNGMQDQNGQYRGYNGVICTELSITNNGDDTFIKDLQLFLPYSELHLGNSGTYNVACHVYIHDNTLGGVDYYLTKSDFVHFNYDASTVTGSSYSDADFAGAAAFLWLLFGGLYLY